MVILQGERRFELTIDEEDGAWVARFLGYSRGCLLPVLYLLGAFATRQEAIDALASKWRLLFPDAAALVWREPSVPPPSHRHSPRPRSARGGRR